MKKPKKYVTRKCKACGEDFTFYLYARTENREICSRRCNTIYNNRNNKSYDFLLVRNSSNNPMKDPSTVEKAMANRGSMAGENNPMFGKSRPDTSARNREERPLSQRLAQSKTLKERRVSVGANNPMYGRPAPKGAGNGKSGIRKDLRKFFRSRWEANFARVLNHLGIEWVFEPRRFIFPDETFTYLPDFYLPATDEYVEIKGYKDLRALRNEEAMQKHYPDIKLRIIARDEYRELRLKYKDVIPNWEE